MLLSSAPLHVVVADHVREFEKCMLQFILLRYLGCFENRKREHCSRTALSLLVNNATRVKEVEKNNATQVTEVEKKSQITKERRCAHFTFLQKYPPPALRSRGACQAAPYMLRALRNFSKGARPPEARKAWQTRR